MEYIRDNDRTHADKHMIDSLAENYSNSFATLANSAFAIDNLLGNERTDNDKAKYDKLLPQAKTLIKQYNVAFDS